MATDPDPVVGVDAPNEVEVGESFTIDVTGENVGEEAGEFSTISVSVPRFDAASDTDQISHVETSLGYRTVASAGETIYSADDEQMAAEYALVEAGTPGETAWQAGDRERLSMDITPSETGTYVFYVRTTLTNPTDTTEKHTTPEHGDARDQQGYRVERITVEVSDGEDQNQAPVIDATAPADGDAVAAGDDVAFAVNADDPDGDDLAYEWIVRRDGDVVADDHDDATRTIDFDEPGTYEVEVEVSDGTETTSHTWAFMVTESNQSPGIEAVSPTGETSLGVDERQTFSVDASDPDGDDIVYTWQVIEDGEVTQTYEGYASRWFEFDDAGTYEVAVDVSDGTATETETWTVEVNDDAARPRITDATPTASEDVMVDPGADASFAVDAENPDGSEAALSYTWRVYHDNDLVDEYSGFNDRRFNYETPGAYRVEVVVENGAGKTTQIWSLMVRDPSRPELTVKHPMAPATVRVGEQTPTFELDVEGVDSSDRVVEWRVSNENGTVVRTADGDLAREFTLDDPSEYHVNATVSTGDRSASHTWDLTVEGASAEGMIEHVSVPSTYAADQSQSAFVRVRNPTDRTVTYQVTLRDRTGFEFTEDNTVKVTVAPNSRALVKIPYVITRSGGPTTVDVRVSTDASDDVLDRATADLTYQPASETDDDAGELTDEEAEECLFTPAKCEDPDVQESMQLARAAEWGQFMPAYYMLSTVRELWYQSEDRNVAEARGSVDGMAAAGVQTGEDVEDTVEAGEQFLAEPIGFTVRTGSKVKRTAEVVSRHPGVVAAAVDHAIAEKQSEIRADSPYEVGTSEYEEYRAAWARYYVSARISTMILAEKGAGKVASKAKRGAVKSKTVIGVIDENPELAALYLKLYGQGYSTSTIRDAAAATRTALDRTDLKLSDVRQVYDVISYMKDRTGTSPETIGDVAEALYLQRVARLTDGTVVRHADNIDLDTRGTYLLHSVDVGPKGARQGEFDVVQVEVTPDVPGPDLRVTKAYEVTQGKTPATAKFTDDVAEGTETKNAQILTTLQDAASGDYQLGKGLRASAFQHDRGVGTVIVGPARRSGNVRAGEMQGPGRVGFGDSLPYTTDEFQVLDEIVETTETASGYRRSHHRTSWQPRQTNVASTPAAVRETPDAHGTPASQSLSATTPG